MARRISNTTRYDHRQRKMLWRLEWSFPAAGASALDQRAPEDRVVSELLAAHVAYQPGRAAEQFALRRYADAGVAALRVFLKQERCRVGVRCCAAAGALRCPGRLGLQPAACRAGGALRPALRPCAARPAARQPPALSPAPAAPPQANDQRWHAIDTSATLASQLAGKLLLEFPTLVVALLQVAGAWVVAGREPASRPPLPLPPQVGSYRLAGQPPPPPPLRAAGPAAAAGAAAAGPAAAPRERGEQEEGEISSSGSEDASSSEEQGEAGGADDEEGGMQPGGEAAPQLQQAEGSSREGADGHVDKKPRTA
jgi:hypothetical protein